MVRISLFGSIVMKKRYFACLALALPALAFAGCTSGASRLAISANWYAAADTTSEISNTYEELVYTVSFESTGTDAYSVEYDEGTYTATLRNENITIGATVRAGYHLTTELTITGRYSVNGETGEDFTDVVISDVWFLDVTTELQPVRSVKKVLSHSPSHTNSYPDSIEDASTTYEYTYTSEYNEDCTEASVALTYTQPEGMPDVERTVSLSGNGTYLDNETILFAMRGINTASALSFRTVNPVTQQQTGIAMSAAPEIAERTQTFAINAYENGTVTEGASVEHTLDAYTFTLGYSGSNAGQSQTLTYAARTDGVTNTYRNVLLEMSVPIINSLGTLTYRLTSATFNGK